MTNALLQPWQRHPAVVPARHLAERFAALVPEVETARLRLRAPRLDDFPIYARFPLYALFGRDGAAAVRDQRALAGWLDFCQLVAGWALRGFGPWTIEPRDGGAALGAVIINHEFGHPEPEIGWVATPEAEGRGLITEAALAARDQAFGPMGFKTLISYIDAGNARSVAVAERLGARRDPAAEAALGNGCLAYRHTAPETPQ